MYTIEVGDDVFKRVQKIGAGLFAPEDVIRRLVDFFENAVNGENHQNPKTQSDSVDTYRGLNSEDSAALLSRRRPRSRGARVTLQGETIYGRTVGDLYKKVFTKLLKGEKSAELKKLIPYRTSNQRYLIAMTAEHPNKSGFWVPVEVGGYFVEAHKNYETAVKQLEELTGRLGIDFKYVG